MPRHTNTPVDFNTVSPAVKHIPGEFKISLKSGKVNKNYRFQNLFQFLISSFWNSLLDFHLLPQISLFIITTVWLIFPCSSSPPFGWSFLPLDADIVVTTSKFFSVSIDFYHFLWFFFSISLVWMLGKRRKVFVGFRGYVDLFFFKPPKSSLSNTWHCKKIFYFLSFSASFCVPFSSEISFVRKTLTHKLV